MAATQNSLSILAWLVEAGADEAVCEAPRDRFAARSSGTARAPGVARPYPSVEGGSKDLPERGPISASTSPTPKSASQISPLREGGDPIGDAIALARGANSLAELKAALESFEGCALKRSATTTVFADGTPAHRIMFIGEAPGRDEDRQGLPFVGRAGKLLDKMLAAMQLDRTKVYITNVLNWRPPDNREPSPEEAAMCLPFLRRHIELVNPEIMVLLGAVSVRHVMGRSDGIMKTRGRWLEYNVLGQMVPVMPTLHPAYLLRQPAHKKLAWRDLLAIDEKIASLRLLERAAASG
jgi:DNA polymerase